MAAYLASERTVVNLTFTFPFSTNRSVWWTGKIFTDNETAQLGVDVHPAASISPHTSNTSQQRVRPPRFSSGKPCQREQFNLFGAARELCSISLIQLPGRVLQYFSPGRMLFRCDDTSKSMSTSTPPKLLHLQHDFLDTLALMPRAASRTQITGISG